MSWPTDRPLDYSANLYYDEGNENWVTELDLADIGGASAKEFIIAVSGDGSVYFGEL